MSKFSTGDKVTVSGVVYATSGITVGVTLNSMTGKKEFILNEKDIITYPDKNEELETFKRDTLETITQPGKTAKEILMDLKDHLTN